MLTSSLSHTLFKTIKIKTYVKILGIHFTYDYRVKQKLDFDELITSIKNKLRIWKRRDLTIIGRIQIVKTFIIPICLSRASMICLDKEFVKEANKIIFKFIWKGKDKIKRLALISDIEDGGLKAPHLDSIIKTQRILCCKRLASEQPSSWKIILLHYLKPVGGQFILCCDYNIKTLPIKLPMFYEECLKYYRASMICLDKEFVKEANKIIFKFIWKGKDKIKRLALISDIEDGGLKAPHLDSIIKTQILCCKRLASEQPSSWKIILLHYLKPVGGKFILCCDYNIKTLPIKLPMFYEECLKYYRASMICLDKEFVKEANKIIFKFIWKGKDKIKRLALISDIEDGGLKAPHLDSIIKTQILCCKRLASEQPSSWKIILLHYLKPVGGKFILCCDYKYKNLAHQASNVL